MADFVLAHTQRWILPGAPLEHLLGRADREVNPAAAHCVADVLRARLRGSDEQRRR
jgi:hypothetical protein